MNRSTVRNLLLCGALLVTPHLATSLRAEPPVRLTVASINQIEELIGYCAKLGGKPEKAEPIKAQLKGLPISEQAGFDTSKRWGLMVELPKEGAPQPMVFIAIKDEAKVKEMLKQMAPQQTTLPSGVIKAEGGSLPPLFVRLGGGYAQLSPATPGAVEVAPIKDPAKLLDGRGVIDLDINVGSLPEPLKKALLDGMKQTMLAKASQQGGSAGPAEAATQATMAGLQKTLDAVEKVDLSIVFDTAAERFSIDLDVVNKAGAKPVATPIAPSLGWTTLVPATAGLAFTCDLALDGSVRDSVEQTFKQSADGIKAKASTDEQKKLAEAIAHEFAGLLKLGRLEGFAKVEGKRGAAHIVVVARMTDDSKIPDILEAQFVKEAKTSKDGEPKKSSVEGVTIWSGKTKGAQDDLGSNEISIGFKKGLAVLVMGPGTVAKITSVVKELATAKTEGLVGGVKGWCAMAAFAEIAGRKVFEKTAADKAGFDREIKAGRDQVGMAMEAIPSGQRMELFVQGGPLALIFQSAMADKVAPTADPSAAGDATPGPDGSPATVGSPAPEASAAPDGGEGESAPASAAPSDGDEGESEAPKTHEKKKEDDSDKKSDDE